MIISHKHKFIFIKTSKTAGTSIEIALSKYCGSEDIVTPIDDNDEKIRRNLGLMGPQNFIVPKSCYGIRDWRRFIFKDIRPKYREHASAEEIRQYIGKEIWGSYFKFCFVRNPWDRMISLYYWHNQEEPRPSLSEFLDSRLVLKFHDAGKRGYTTKGKIAVDKVFFYENLEVDLESARIACGLPESLILPNAKGKSRKDRRDYRKILNNEQIEKIRNISKPEIELFGYKY